MPDHRIPSLPAHLRWLIELPLALPEIEVYTRKQTFTVANIFSSPAGAQQEQRAYDLPPGHLSVDNLADAEIFHPLTVQVVPYVVFDQVGVAVTQFPALGNDYLELHCLDPITRQPRFNDEFVRQLTLNAAHRHSQEEWLCQRIGAEWEDAFHYYRGTPDLGPRVSQRLYLNPHVTPLPDPQFIERLVREGQTYYLLLVTARHEMGYLYEKALAWYRMSPLSRPGSALNEWDRGLLAARSRMMLTMRDAPSRDRLGKEITTPRLNESYGSDVAKAFGLMTSWIRKVHNTTLGVQECAKDDCHNPVRGRYGGGAKKGGAPSKYCDIHTTSRKHRASTE